MTEEYTTPAPSWTGGLGRTGGFYADADWYVANITRRMPLVTTMMEELVYALPPVGEGKVLDLLTEESRSTCHSHDLL